MDLNEEDLLKNIKALDNWSTSVNNLATKLSKQYFENVDDNKKDELETQLKNVLTNYKNAKTDEEKQKYNVDYVLNSLNTLSDNYNNQNNTPVTKHYTPINYDKYLDDDTGLNYDLYTDGDNVDNQDDNSNVELEPAEYSTGSTKNNSTDDIVELDPEAVGDATNLSTKIGNGIEGATLDIPGPVAPYCGDMSSIAQNAVNELRERCRSFINSLMGIKDEVEGLDEAIDQLETNWGNIKELSYNRDYNHEVNEATADFFIKCGYKVINDVVTITDDSGKTYEYNLATRTLTVDGASIKCRIFAPDNVDDYSHLNTYTYFTMSSTKESDDMHYDKYIDDPTSCGYGESVDKSPLKGNAIIIQIDKKDVSYTKGDNMFMTDEGHNMVPETTKFVNLIANTDLENNRCRNIIGGDSKFGAYALGIAADNGDLYKTIYCVNNAVCVNKNNPDNAITTEDGKVLKGNVSGTNKTQLTTEQLRNLSGKDIYMIYASGDPNQTTDGAGKKLNKSSSASLKNCVALTGLDYLCNAASPDTNINVIYCNDDAHVITRRLYAEKAEQYDNLTYYEDNWHRFARNEHSSHSDGNWLITELLEADTTNCNYYYH